MYVPMMCFCSEAASGPTESRRRVRQQISLEPGSSSSSQARARAAPKRINSGISTRGDAVSVDAAISLLPDYASVERAIEISGLHGMARPGRLGRDNELILLSAHVVVRYRIEIASRWQRGASPEHTLLFSLLRRFLSFQLSKLVVHVIGNSLRV